jgi:hypothetical protein
MKTRESEQMTGELFTFLVSFISYKYHVLSELSRERSIVGGIAKSARIEH